MKNYQLSACSDPEGRPPKGETGRDIEVHRSALLVTVAAFKQSVGKPRERPYLSAVRMSAEKQEDGEGREPVENTECPFEDSRKSGHGLQPTDENITIGTYVGAQHQNENN